MSATLSWSHRRGCRISASFYLLCGWVLTGLTWVLQISHGKRSEFTKCHSASLPVWEGALCSGKSFSFPVWANHTWGRSCWYWWDVYTWLCWAWVRIWLLIRSKEKLFSAFSIRQKNGNILQLMCFVILSICCEKDGPGELALGLIPLTQSWEKLAKKPVVWVLFDLF